MSKSNDFEADVANLIFLATGIPGLADDAASSPLSVLWFSLHNFDPGETGDQTTDELSYSGYARVSVPRSSVGFWTQSISPSSSTQGQAVYLQNDLVWPESTDAFVQSVATHVGIGTAASGAGKLLYKLGINVSQQPLVKLGITPILSKSVALFAER